MTEPTTKLDICLDATMFDTFDTCECKYNYRFNFNLTSIDKPEPLDKGSLIHEGFEPYYLALKAGQPFEIALEQAKMGFDLAATESDLEPDTIRTMKNAMIENLNFWRHRDARREILEVEKPFAYILFEDQYIRITMIGKIDLLTNEDSYTNLPTDHKTYARDFPILKTANQFCNYAYALNSNYLFVNRVGLQTSLPPEKKHKRVPLSYDPIFLESWRQNTIKHIYHYVECYSENSWPMRFTSCSKFNRICEYNDVCTSSGDEAKAYKLATQFKKTDKWDVAKSLGLKK